VTYAYCPAFDFDPKETDMTFEEITAILKDSTRTDYQKAADIHAALTKASKPSVMTLQPMKTRKPRQDKVCDVSPASEAANGSAGHVDSEGGVQ
jgi:hypothetical protein